MKFLLALIVIILLNSCSERTENITCAFYTGGSYPVLGFYINGYTLAETDTVVINWYKEGSNHKDLVKTRTVKYDDSVFISMANRKHPAVARYDSISRTSYYIDIFILSGSDPFKGYDAEVLLPGAGNVRHTIQNIIVEGNITEKQKVHIGDEGYCLRKVVSYEVDGSYIKNVSNGSYVSFTK